MPLHETQDPADPTTLKDAKEEYLVFYSSRDETGNLWCPDCVAVDDAIQQAFGPAEAPSALIVYVGQRAAWKSRSNVFRAAPWKVDSVPTIVRVKDGERLVDSEIAHKLAAFVHA
ncbi:Thioredoxin domain-containing protein 17 [Grifola frondosa]|uniref:Thioredoxin domain-containing protein 17 n=1 Tax=Grifola frondosa TaxID=5627 RepID=A0A1C7MQG0_GRIFR|nr:Thioredoxin domain-containing protein 17 [Grifola frondosa]